VNDSSFLATIEAIEGLYRAVVEQPDAWGEQAFADWANERMASAGELPNDAVREIRRSLRAAQKLQAFWTDRRSQVDDHGDWESKVDIALGPRAWRPLLDLARIGLEHAPSEEIFEQVRTRFSLVNSDRWMDGISYQEWAANS
jgi:hypothetical protein